MAETVFTPQDLEVHQKIADHLRLDKEHIDRDGFMIESNEWGQHLLHWRGIRLLTQRIRRWQERDKWKDRCEALRADVAARASDSTQPALRADLNWCLARDDQRGAK